MQISMKDLEKLTLREMEDLLAGSRKVRWTSENTEAKYNFISVVLKQQSYSKLGKRERGVVRQFLAKVAAVSRAQMTRLIAQWTEHRTIKRKPAPRPNFVCRYRKEDIHLLAATDAAHEDLSGPALRRILHREYQVFGKPEYERLSQISVSHIYNLRQSDVYRRRRVRVNKPKAGRF
jgi:NADH:ubiquinone oxidoreductase subunit D